MSSIKIDNIFWKLIKPSIIPDKIIINKITTSLNPIFSYNIKKKETTIKQSLCFETKLPYVLRRNL